MGQLNNDAYLALLGPGDAGHQTLVDEELMAFCEQDGPDPSLDANLDLEAARLQRRLAHHRRKLRYWRQRQLGVDLG